MWPGEQPPGGEQNPQQPNPYQQPGFGQPNPYQQPGYGGQSGQPGAAQPGYGQQAGYGGQPGYGQPPQPGFGEQQQPYGANPAWGPASSPGGPLKPGGGNRRRNTAIAIVASVAVVAAAAVGGVFLFGGSDDSPKGAPAPSASNSDAPQNKPTKAQPEATASDGSDPVTPGWQTVVNPKWFSAFDVPKTKDWNVEKPSMITAFEDENGELLPGVGMSAPAYYKKDWCKNSTRASVGTKGAQGSKNTKQAAKLAAANFAIGAFDQKQQGTLKQSKPEAFRNTHGIKGHAAAAQVTGAPKEDKCSADGKVVTVSWINKNDDLAIWVFYSDANVKDEVPNATVKKMMASLRDYDGGTDSDDEPRG